MTARDFIAKELIPWLEWHRSRYEKAIKLTQSPGDLGFSAAISQIKEVEDFINAHAEEWQKEGE